MSNPGLPGSGELERDQRLQKIKDRWNERVALSVHAGASPAGPHDPTPDQIFEQAKADVNWLLHQLQALSGADAREALTRLTPHVRHDANCATSLADTDCSCGASAALQAMHAAVRSPAATGAPAEWDWLADFWMYWVADPAGEWFSDFLETAKVAFESQKR